MIREIQEVVSRSRDTRDFLALAFLIFGRVQYICSYIVTHTVFWFLVLSYLRNKIF